MPKRVLTGTVVSDKGDKTVVIRVERRVKHPLYGKIIRLSKKYHAHDAANEFRAGEIVRIEECAPISKLKTWTVLDRIGTAKAAVVEITEPEALAPDAPAETPKPIEEKAEKPVEEKAEKKPAEKKPPVKKPPVKKPPVKKPAKKAKAKDVAKADA
jgi:small subunit ribosomal protein S17